MNISNNQIKLNNWKTDKKQRKEKWIESVQRTCQSNVGFVLSLIGMKNRMKNKNNNKIDEWKIYAVNSANQQAHVITFKSQHFICCFFPLVLLLLLLLILIMMHSFIYLISLCVCVRSMLLLSRALALFI